MNWTIEKPIYHQGAQKKVTKFAWLPTRIDIEKTLVPPLHRYKFIWLEKYRATYRWVVLCDELGRNCKGFWDWDHGESL